MQDAKLFLHFVISKAKQANAVVQPSNSKIRQDRTQAVKTLQPVVNNEALLACQEESNQHIRDLEGQIRSIELKVKNAEEIETELKENLAGKTVEIKKLEKEVRRLNGKLVTY